MPSFIYRIGGTGTILNQTEQDNNIMCIYGELKANYGWSDEAIAGACGCFHEESHFNPGIYETSHGGNLNNLPYFTGGMGLAQWTDYPAYSGTYPNPLPWSADREGKDWWDGIFQCWLMNKAPDDNYTSMGYPDGPRWGWMQSPDYASDNMPWNSFINYTGSISQACRTWFFCFEWHASEALAYQLLGPTCITDRINWAQYCYDLFHGQTPDPPGPGPGPGPGPSPTTTKKMPLWMYLKRYPF